MKHQPGDYIYTSQLTEDQVVAFLRNLERSGARVFSLNPRSALYYTGEHRDERVGWCMAGGLAVGNNHLSRFSRDVTGHYVTRIEGAETAARSRAVGRCAVLLALAVVLFLWAVTARADFTLTASDNIVNTYDGNSVEIGYRTADDWEFQAGYVQPARTAYGDRGGRPIFTATKRFEFGRVLFGKFGAAVTPDYQLIGPANFRFGGGVRLGRWEIEFMHASSAGIFEDNLGFDTVGVRYVF